jgi:hypothetical protein
MNYTASGYSLGVFSQFFKGELLLIKTAAGMAAVGIKMYKWQLDCETLTATATSAGIGVVEIETFPIETIREIQFSIHQVEKTFQVGNNLYSIVLKTLVHWLCLIIKIHFIA